jgi:hypothetical protein
MISLSNLEANKPKKQVFLGQVVITRKLRIACRFQSLKKDPARYPINN